MRLVLALGGHSGIVQIVNELRVDNLLLAYPYKSMFAQLDHAPWYFITDSGAFSAWASGKPTDLTGYGDWSLEVTRSLPRAISVNLDIIPGERGRTSSPRERVEGMSKSLANADYLRGRNLNVMEVFHQDEPQSFLDDLLDRLPENGILGIATRKDKPVGAWVQWLQVVLNHLVSRYGWANLPRTHGLAATSKPVMQAFPFYSVDSSTYTSPYRYGTMVNSHGKMIKMAAALGGTTGSRDTRGAWGVRQTIMNQENIATEVTRLWEKRGIIWTD